MLIDPSPKIFLYLVHKNDNAQNTHILRNWHVFSSSSQSKSHYSLLLMSSTLMHASAKIMVIKIQKKPINLVWIDEDKLIWGIKICQRIVSYNLHWAVGIVNWDVEHSPSHGKKRYRSFIFLHPRNLIFTLFLQKYIQAMINSTTYLERPRKNMLGFGISIK